MKYGTLMKLYVATCKLCHKAVQADTLEKKTAVDWLHQRGWIQTRSGWKCYECQQKRMKSDESADSNGKAAPEGENTG